MDQVEFFPDTTRRGALRAFIGGTLALMAGGLAALLGSFAVVPRNRRQQRHWLRAGNLIDLTPKEPRLTVLSVTHEQGWYRERTGRVVFLVWDGENDVRALSSTCTHLGCRVGWNPRNGHFECPCHGGVYDARGRILGGPPPRPLGDLPVRVDETSGEVLVQL